MNIQQMRLDEIVQYDKNPRKNDQAVKYVQESIKQFGFKVPIIVDKNNVIVAGHTRYKAAKNLRLETVPCVIADDLTEEQVKAFRLADNKVSEFATWDFELLNSELDILQDFDIDMADFGFYNAFDENQFEDMFNSEAEEAEEDDQEEEPEAVRYKVVIHFESKEEAEQAATELREQGYDCEVSR